MPPRNGYAGPMMIIFLYKAGDTDFTGFKGFLEKAKNKMNQCKKIILSLLFQCCFGLYASPGFDQVIIPLGRISRNQFPDKSSQEQLCANDQ